MHLKLILIIAIICISGCAAHYSPDAILDPYGFFSGLWHGAISSLTISINIFSWLLSLFGISFLNDIQIIGKPNDGFFYYFGFLIGFMWLPLFR